VGAIGSSIGNNMQLAALLLKETYVS